jgi:hypothetical protein
MGNIRTETLTAFSAEEFGKILGKMPQSDLALPAAHLPLNWVCVPDHRADTGRFTIGK